MPTPYDLDAEPPLLLVLDGIVRRGGAQSGMRQEVCVGVERADGVRWWRARLGPRFVCGFVDKPSATAHATLLLSETAAQRLLTTGRLEPGGRLDGNPDVLARFIDRYTTKISHFGFRMAAVQTRRDRSNLPRRKNNS